MEPWDLKETYALVKAAHGVKQQKLTQECARSVVDRQLFAQYHYREMLRLSKGFEKRYLKGSMLIDLHGPNSEKTRTAFEIYIVKAGAHVTAAVQCIHAIPDILAHVAYFASGQRADLDALREKKLGLPAVVRTLKSNPAFRSIALILSSAQSGNYWHHLAAVANTSKHRTVIRAALSEDWTGKREHYRELQLSSFSRDGEHFPAISVRDLLGSEFQRLSGIVVTLGHELNACLRSAAT
jgi:hypothetical protein